MVNCGCAIDSNLSPLRAGNNLLQCEVSRQLPSSRNRLVTVFIISIAPLSLNNTNTNELPNGNILVSFFIELVVLLGLLTLEKLFDNGALRHGESLQFFRGIEVDRATKKIVWE